MPWPTLPGSEPFPAELQARLDRAVGADSHRQQGRRFVNRLALESSPYLRQHDGNPVSWFPWGDEAFAEARRLRRPVFLSIGYSTCHWCHVMAEESFADETIAAFLNAHYVAVKVDREERPDVDAAYMRAAQMLGGGGGWPLSVWITDEREPFFAGTYFPPYTGMRGSALGFLDCLAKLLEVYQNEPSRVREVSRKVIATMRAVSDSGVGGGHSVASVDREGPALLAAAAAALSDDFDEQYGGLRLTQKFPSHVPVRLLLRQHRRTGDVQALHMAVRTLEAMAAGGIYDHLGGGFHRYSTDPAWRLPHFEKMLYDNALLVPAYVEAWQVTHNHRFARIARETCEALLNTFAAPSGGFFSATDADSEGEEGRYFIWTEAEARSVLGADERADAFLRYFGLVGDGELGSGHVLHEDRPDEEVRRSLEALRARLLEVRSHRIPPHRDEKILSAWNGLAISAFAVAGRALGEPRYVDAAARAAAFVLGELRNPDDGGLLRSVCDARKGGPGFIDDYAFVVAGLLDLFESSSEPRWFDAACALAEQTERNFADAEHGGWFATGCEHERLFSREKWTHDGAEPAGSSVALMNAARLTAFTDDEKWRKIVRQALAFYLPLLQDRPLAMAEALLAADFCAGPVREIVLAYAAGNPAGDQGLSRVLQETFCPRKVIVAGTPGSNPWSDLQRRIPFLRDKVAGAGITTAYVCEGGACRKPTTDAAELANQLTEGGAV